MDIVEGDYVWAKSWGWPLWPARVEAITPSGNGRRKISVILMGPEKEEIIVDDRSVWPWEKKKPRFQSRTRVRIFPAWIKENFLAAVAEVQGELVDIEMHRRCAVCNAPPDDDDDHNIILCDDCDRGFHMGCLTPRLFEVPEGDWFCPDCRGPMSPVAALVVAACDRVVRSYRASAQQPLPPITAADADGAPPVNVLVSDGAWREGRIVAEIRNHVYIEHDEPTAPQRTYVYRAKEDDKLKDIVTSHYADAAVAFAVRQVVATFAGNSFGKRGVKLKELTQVNLPEYHLVVGDESLGDIARQYGRAVDELISLNKSRFKGLPGSDSITCNALAREILLLDDIVLLPAAMPSARHKAALGPQTAQWHPMRPSNVALVPGNRVWVATKGVAELSDEEGVVIWRPAVVTRVDGTTFAVGCVAGDAGWNLPSEEGDEPFKLDGEGDEWVRHVEWLAPFTPNRLIAPWEARRSICCLSKQDKDYDALVLDPPPPRAAAGWAAELVKGSWCEVRFDGSWHVAQVDARDTRAAHMLEVALYYKQGWIVNIDEMWLRPCRGEIRDDESMVDDSSPSAVAADSLSEDGLVELEADEPVADRSSKRARADFCGEEPAMTSRRQRCEEMHEAPEDGVEDEQEEEEEEEVVQQEQEQEQEQEQQEELEEEESEQQGDEGEHHQPEADNNNEEDTDEAMAPAPPLSPNLETFSGDETDGMAPDVAVVDARRHYVDSYARTTIKKVSEFTDDEQGLLDGARRVLDGRFGSAQWHKSLRLVDALLGHRPFPSPGLNNVRPPDFGRTLPLLTGKAGQKGKLGEIGVAVLAHGSDGVIAACSFNLCKKTHREEHAWALEVILFAVRKDFEGQGVARRLLQELFRFASDQKIGQLIVLSAERMDHPRNYWMVKGGFDCDNVSSACSTFTGLNKHFNGVPDCLILPWEMFNDEAAERAAEVAARKKAVQSGDVSREEDATAEQLAKYGFNLVTVLVAYVPCWSQKFGVRSDVVNSSAAVAAAVTLPAAVPPPLAPLPPAASSATGIDVAGSRVAPVRGAPALGNRSGRPRKLRAGEFMSGSSRLAKKLIQYGADVLCVEREVDAPEYDGKSLVRPHGPSAPGTQAAAMREASMSASHAPAKAYLEVCQCRDLRPFELPTLDYAHFSPQCTSVSNAAGDAHKREEDDGFLGSDECCREYNRDLAWIIDVIHDQKRRPGNESFKYTIEAPFGVARKVPHFKWIEVPVEDGGLGAVRLVLSYCMFGMEYEKKTFFWTNIGPLIETLPGTQHNYLCRQGRQCHRGRDNHKNLGRDAGPTRDAATFPEDLVAFLRMHVIEVCATRREDSVTPYPVCQRW